MRQEQQPGMFHHDLSLSLRSFAAIILSLICMHCSLSFQPLSSLGAFFENWTTIMRCRHVVSPTLPCFQSFQTLATCTLDCTAIDWNGNEPVACGEELYRAVFAVTALARCHESRRHVTTSILHSVTCA